MSNAYFNHGNVAAQSGPSQQYAATGSGLMLGGQVISHIDTEQPSLNQIATYAGLGFNIRRASVAYKNQFGEVQHNPTVKQMFRDDTFAPLGGTVSNRFKPLQPRTMVDIAAQITHDATDGGYQVTNAGSLDGGAGMWILARKKGFDLSGDKTDHTIMIVTDNTGRAATQVFRTSLRWFCLNQLAAAFGGAQDKISVRHTTDWTPQYTQGVVAQIKQSNSAADKLADAADNMARSAVTNRQAVNYFAELYVERDDKNNVTNETALERVVNNIMESYKYGPGSHHVAANGTQWGMLNAVTHYIDHVTRARSDDNRFKSAITGTGYNRKLKAIELIQGNEYKPLPAGGQPLLLA